MQTNRVIDAARLVAEKQGPTIWLLERVIPAGSLVILAGEMSACKSFLGLELALGVTSRGKAWGLNCAMQGSARYLCVDADRGELARRVRSLCAGHGISVPESLRFDFGKYVFEDGLIDTLARDIQQDDCKLVIVDPLSRYLPWMSDNSTRSVAMGLQAMRELAQKTGVTVVMLQAFNKLIRRPSNKWGEHMSDGTERVRGSSELVAGCDVAILVTRGRNRNKIELVKNRQGRTRWTSQFSLVDGSKSDASLHIVFEALQPEQTSTPSTLAELVELRFKRIMRSEPERSFSRAELVAETQKLIGAVGQRAWAQAFVLLGRDEEIKVEHADKNLKRYHLEKPGTAMFNMLVEKGGELAAIDIMGKKLEVEAKVRLVERQYQEMQEKKQDSSALDEIYKQLKEEKMSS
ncbi:MAG: AAA family ATPase [Anaerolineaceae bacterium]